MQYADPVSCLACRGSIGGVERCATCGFDLTSPAAHQLWGLFIQADSIVSAERARSVAQSSGRTSVTPTAATEAPINVTAPNIGQEPPFRTAHRPSFVVSP